MSGDEAWLFEFLTKLVPGGKPLPPVREPVLPDETKWFRRAVTEKIIEVAPCVPSCTQSSKAGFQRHDEFTARASHAGRRHLFSLSAASVPNLNREYIPHIAAYARAVTDLGYPADHASFSEYRTFTRNWLTKKAGQSYELDALFCSPTVVRPLLQIEAKGRPSQTAALAAG